MQREAYFLGQLALKNSEEKWYIDSNEWISSSKHQFLLLQSFSWSFGKVYKTNDFFEKFEYVIFLLVPFLFSPKANRFKF